MKSFGKELRKLREGCGLTQTAVAELVGVSNAYVSSLESGSKPAPPHAIVAALAEALGVEVVQLWKLAREEREQRLLNRVKGRPTSLHTRSVEAVPDKQEEYASSLPQDSHSDPVSLLLKLIEAVPSASERQEILDSLKRVSDMIGDAGTARGNPQGEQTTD